MTREDIAEERVTLADLVDRAIKEKGYGSREDFIENELQIDIKLNSLFSWLHGKTHFPLEYLLKIVKALEINLDDFTRAYVTPTNSTITPFKIEKYMEALNLSEDLIIESYGGNPFLPPIDEILESVNPLGNFLDWYIEFRTGLSRAPYFRKNNYSKAVFDSRFSGRVKFPTFHLKNICDDLQIPVEELSQVFGRNPFVPPIDEFLESENPVSDLLDWYIEFRTGIRRKKYFEQRKYKLSNFSVARIGGLFSGRIKFTSIDLKKICDDLQIPVEELSQVYGRNPFVPPMDEILESESPLGNFLDWYIEFRTGFDRKRYFKQSNGELSNYSHPTFSNWFSGKSNIPTFHLKNICDDLQIPVEELSQVYGRNPFVPPMDEILESESPLGNFLDWYIEFQTGLVFRLKYFKQNKDKLGNYSDSIISSWFSGKSNIPTFLLKNICDDLQIPVEELSQVYGRNPFVPPMVEFMKSKGPLGKLLDWYIEFRTGLERKKYFKQQKGEIGNYSDSKLSGWFSGRINIPTFDLKNICDDLQIPEEELSQVYGRDPFVPPIDDILESESPLGNLLDWYIEFRTGFDRTRYFKYNKGAVCNYSISIFHSRFSGKSKFPTFHLKNICDDLKIPEEELSQVFGRNPFVPPMDEILESESPLGNLLDWYIEFQTGLERINYFKQRKDELNNYSDGKLSGWFSGKSNFPTIDLKKVCDDLKIPEDELYQVFGRNPFVPPMDDIMKSKGPLGKLLDWYIEFRTGWSREKYLEETNGSVKNLKYRNFQDWFSGKSKFPILNLKAIVDNLEIPYDQVNQFIDYDIATVEPPVVYNDEYIERRVSSATQDEAVRYLWGIAKECGVTEAMASCICDVIVASDPELLKKRSRIRKNLGPYLGEMRGLSIEPDTKGLLPAIEQFLEAYNFLGEMPDVVTDVLTELTIDVYLKKYNQGKEGKISNKIQEDMTNSNSLYLNTILGKAKEFFVIKEGLLDKVYQDSLHPTVKVKKVV